MSYWYVAHDDELLIDLDDYMRPTRTGCPWGEAFFRLRLRDAMNAGKLQILSVWLVPSNSDRHYSAIVQLSNSTPLNLIQRLIWQLYLGSDLYRARADLMRAANGVPNPSLLILPKPIRGFYRKPDAQCSCTEKHSTEQQFERMQNGGACAVWVRYRGRSPWELFGRTYRKREKFVPLPVGRVPLNLILTKREEPCQ